MKHFIDEFPNYCVSDDGHIFNSVGDEIKQILNKNNGYMQVHLCKNGKPYTRKVHRLVAETFIPNPDCLPQVNHKDGNKLNNNVTNLEWCTQSYNIKHSIATGLLDNSIGSRANAEKHGKSVICIQNGCIIAKYINISEASKQTGISRANISSCCNGKRKTAGNYEWRFI